MGTSDAQVSLLANMKYIILWFQDVWTLFAVLLIIWLFSILLMISNRELIRILEGYYFLNSPYLEKLPPKCIQLYRFKRMNGKTSELKEKKRFNNASPKEQKKYMKLRIELSKKYPFEEKQILPTSFGNSIKAFEVYPLKVYGFDAIPVWPRILFLLPDNVKDKLNASKACVDFAVNMTYLLSIIFIEYVVLAYINNDIKTFLIPVIILLFIILSYKFALISVLEWGDVVKAIFDVYSNTLLSEMRLKNPTNWNEKRKVWTSLSQVFIYRIPPEDVNLELDPLPKSISNDDKKH